MNIELQKKLFLYRKQKCFNEEKWIKNKCEMFNNYLKKHNLSGAIISVSGGIDSAVTLALLHYTKNMSGSVLKKIYAVNQPIRSSNWALERSKELCDRFDIEFFIIDQSEYHTMLVDKITQATGIEGNKFSTGQLKSYMRTPVNYYLSQLMNQNGYPSVVVGTGNKDEDGYLCYFCKYGDGAVDIQLISDLHKNEVFKIGNYLKVPSSILEASPSADLWDGQEDENELGITYDFIELFTGYYLPLDDENKKIFIDSLSDDIKNEFLNKKKICEEIHNRNKHKLHGVINC